MGEEFTFYDYVDVNGINVIKKWLNGDGGPAKAFFAVKIPLLEASPPPRSKESVWEAYTKPMRKKKGQDWHGFRELRKTGSVNYRLIFYIEDRQAFLVATAIHKGQNFTPDVSPQTARMRVLQMKNDPKYRRAHEYN